MNKFLYIILICFFTFTIISCSSSDDGATTTTDNTTPTDTTTTALKMLSAGAAARASYMLVTDELKNQVTVKADATMVDKAMYGAIGLACPCDGSRDYALNAPLDYPTLNVNTVDTVYNEAEQNYQVDKSKFAA